uniref:Uncharacterized protein n=1 Tax=Calcidiscus leptoporus TaxID=127549 RepID=A0A7S0J1N8_9EUKA|mmetsp:Transcript_34070/g.79794  ORF Transcript_34070/g.79794 Transcript_34070/m.79794 type:complete len:195 (+) Transcript_34070:21-605(+)
MAVGCAVMFTMGGAVSAFQTMIPTRVPSAVRSGAASMAVEDMMGKYSVKGTVFDPLGLADKYDLNWLREAELKHGRVCMLAFAGFIANDAGLKFPGKVFEGVSSIEAHDAMVKSGHMWALLIFVGICESLHMSVVVPKLDGDWGDYEPGNYGLDPFKLDSPARRESELKNGRLAMIAFSGIVTQAALGAPAPYF